MTEKTFLIEERLIHVLSIPCAKWLLERISETKKKIKKLKGPIEEDHE